MTEHVNFYTPQAIRTLMEHVGLTVLNIQENNRKSVLGNSRVLSILCRKN